MAKNRGFTLVELLAVIVILAIILAIAIPRITDLLDSVKISAYKNDEKMLVKSAKSYVAINSVSLPKNNGDTIEIKLSDLQSANFITPIKDPKNNSITCDGYVLVTKNSADNYNYDPYLNCSEGLVAGSYTNDGLTAYWKLDGNAYDYSPNGKHGTINGGAVATADRYGTAGKALSFDGINDYILFPTINTGNTNWTVSVWAKTANSVGTIVSNSSGGPVYNTLSVSSSKITYIYYLSSWLTTSGTTTITDNQWHLLTWVNYSNNTLDFYVDGIKDGTVSPSTIATLGPLDIIGRNWSTTYYTGSLSDLRFYSRALSATEIKFIYDIEKN